MRRDREIGSAARDLFDTEEIEGVLSGVFYAPPPEEGTRAARAKTLGRGSARTSSADATQSTRGRPDHYKVICISMYTGDLERLDAMVEKLKANGLTKASRSALIRHALDTVDLDKVPRGI